MIPSKLEPDLRSKSTKPTAVKKLWHRVITITFAFQKAPTVISHQRTLSINFIDGDNEILSPKRKLKLPGLFALSFVLFVVLPGIVSSFYLFFIASNQFVAEARFAIRTAPNVQMAENSAQPQNSFGFSSMPQLSGQDAYVVADYLRSRAIIQDISQEIDVAKIYQRPEADFWARLKLNPSIEEIENYWRSKVTVSVESSSGIIAFTIKAFRPDDAEALAKICLKASEALINTLSQRARQDVLSKAEDEVRRTELLLRNALIDLRRLRDQRGFIDPLAEAKTTSQLLLAAISERAKLQTDLFVLERAATENSPTAKALHDRLQSIEVQIEKLQSQLTNQKDTNSPISAALVEFEELELRRLFAEKLHNIAQLMLERARTTTQQQQLYLSVFVPPAKPEDARYPERVLSSLMIAAVLFMIWSTLALTTAAIRDHVR